MLHKVFAPVTAYVLELVVPWDGRVIFVKRTFPELVLRSAQNLVQIGLAVHA